MRDADEEYEKQRQEIVDNKPSWAKAEVVDIKDNQRAWISTTTVQMGAVILWQYNNRIAVINVPELLRLVK